MNVGTKTVRLGLFVLMVMLLIAGIVVINKKSSLRSRVEPGEELPGINQANARTGHDVGPNDQETLAELRKLTKHYEQMAVSLSLTAREIGELAKSLRESAPNGHGAIEDFHATNHADHEAGEKPEAAAQLDADKIGKTIDNLNEVLKRLSQILNDDNQRNFSESMKNARVGSENMLQMIKNTDEYYKEGRAAMRRANDLFAITEKVMLNLQQATGPLADYSEKIMKNLNESSEKLNHVLAGCDELLRAIIDGDGTFQRLLTDPALYNHLNELTCGALQLMPCFQRITRDMQVFVDKIARHPELLGLGGVVRPSMGIKEAPVPVPVPVWPQPPGH
jgi:hypothetical protein